VVEVDVVGGRVSGLKPDAGSHHKRDSLGLGLTYCSGGCCPALGFVEHFVREFVNKGAELLGCCLSGKYGDASAVAPAQSWRDGLLELKLDALGGDELDQAFAILFTLPLCGVTVTLVRRCSSFGQHQVQVALPSGGQLVIPEWMLDEERCQGMQIVMQPVLAFSALQALRVLLDAQIDSSEHPSLLNDRLLLGLKGTMSEFEISLLRQRAMEAHRQKVQRGMVMTQVPVGYVRTEDEGIERTPDRQVQEAILGVFGKFRELGSARQVFLWYRDEKLLLPALSRESGNRKVVWMVTYTKQAAWTTPALLVQRRSRTSDGAILHHLRRNTCRSGDCSRGPRGAATGRD